MKKQVLTLIAAIITSVTFAQNSKVVSAYNYLKYDELDNAKEAIDIASGNVATSGKAKTWYYRGKVYEAIFNSTNEKYKNLDPNALNVAYESFKKALAMPDVKKIDIADLKRRYSDVRVHMVNTGIDNFKAKDYTVAIPRFEAAIDVYKYFNVIDSLSYYYAGVSAVQEKQSDKANTYLRKCIEIDYQGSSAYNYLADMANLSGDEANYKKIIEEGRAKYPNNSKLLTDQINLYLKEGNSAGALVSLNQAIEKDASNATLYCVRGNMYEQNMKLDSLNKEEHAKNAKSDYNKAIELNGTYFDAYYNLGAMIYNEAIAYMDMVSTIKDNTKYAAEKLKAEAIFVESLPFLEKAHEINPEDVSTMTSLKTLYVRTKNNDKYNEMKEKLEK